MKQKFKLKSTVLMQQEQVIQQKQQAIDEQVKLVGQLKQHAELTRVEMNDLQTLNATLKTKLSEA